MTKSRSHYKDLKQTLTLSNAVLFIFLLSMAKYVLRYWTIPTALNHNFQKKKKILENICT